MPPCANCEKFPANRPRVLGRVFDLNVVQTVTGIAAEALDHTPRASRAAQATSSLPLAQVALQLGPFRYAMGQNGQYMEEVSRLLSEDLDPTLRFALLATRGIAAYNRGDFLQATTDFRAAFVMETTVCLDASLRIGGATSAVVLRIYASGTCQQE